MFDRAVLIDTVDIGALGVGSVSNDGRLGGRRAKWDFETVPGRYGAILVASQPQIRPRELDLRFIVEAASRTALLALRDELLSRLGLETIHTFRFVDDETRETTGVITSIGFRGIEPDLTQDAFQLILGVLCPDPREYATTDTVVGSIGVSDVALPLGATRTEGVIVVTAAAAFTLTYKSSGAVTVHTLEIAGATSPVTIDMATGLITDFDGNAIDHLVEPSDFPFSFDPQDGDFPTAAWPTLNTSAGTAVATYRKAY